MNGRDSAAKHFSFERKRIDLGLSRHVRLGSYLGKADGREMNCSHPEAARQRYRGSATF